MDRKTIVELWDLIQNHKDLWLDTEKFKYDNRCKNIEERINVFREIEKRLPEYCSDEPCKRKSDDLKKALWAIVKKYDNCAPEEKIEFSQKIYESFPDLNVKDNGEKSSQSLLTKILNKFL